ncbi:MAG: DUF1254 domain-containing protein [Simkania sp.]|nr:DUF1254 domain-containing protein [Simkania sp.]
MKNRIHMHHVKCIVGAIATTLMLHPVPLIAQETPAQTKAVEEWTYSLALQAATWGAPLVTMYALRYNDAVGPNAKARPNTIWCMENISTPELSKEAGYVTPNVNVIYGFGFMDLRTEPIILEVPDSMGRYYMIEIVDMWTNAFSYIGGKATGYRGGKFALVGPGWKGEIPPSIQRIDCPTSWVLIQPRVHIYAKGVLDLLGAKKILNAIKPTGLASFTGKPPPISPHYNYLAPEPIHADLPVSVLKYKDPNQFWDLLMSAMNENPPPEDQINALLPMFKPLGLELYKTWDRSKLTPQVLEVMSRAAGTIGTLLDRLPLETMYQGAFIPPPTIGDFGTDYKTRAIVGRVGLTANTPEESVYWMYSLDTQGNVLTGENRYTMLFKQEIPFYTPGFWSITMYDAENNYTVPNPIHRYMLGSDSSGVKKNPDGSFTLYMQRQNPGKEMESNWLPAPSGRFHLILRAYPPKPEIIRLLTDATSWPIPVVEKLKGEYFD